MIQTESNPRNRQQGNSQFGELTRKYRNSKKKLNIEDINYLSKTDRRMRFNNSQDPIYYVFDCLENRPIKTLAKEFVKDSVFEITRFVTRVVG